MEALAKKYPDDVEAKIFYALALNETFDHKTMGNLLKAIKILEPIDKKYPDHPGITHYLIHSYDFAPIAKQGRAGRQQVREDRAVGAARAAHAFAHLLDGRHVGGVDRVQPELGRGGQRIRREDQARRRARGRAALARTSCSTPTCSSGRMRRRRR